MTCSSASSPRSERLGAVEIVALCGLYAIMGYMVTAFDIPIEDGFPAPPS